MGGDRAGWKKPPATVRLYRRLLRLVPGEIGGIYANDAGRVFEDLYEAARRRGRLRGLTLFARSVLMLVAVAWAEKRDARRTDGRKRSGGMSALLGELRFSARALRKRPGFSITAVLILAVGIGATTTIFSVVDTVVLRQMPYPDAGQLVFFDHGAFSFPDFREWLELKSFESIGAAQGSAADLTGDGSPERLQGVSVSPRFLPMLGAAPAIGRLFDADDYREGSNVVVISDATWRRLWGGRPDVVGRTLRINGQPMVVIGVLASSFEPPQVAIGSRVDLWFPLGSGGDRANSRQSHVLSIIARLERGTTLAVAQQEVDAQRSAAAEQYPEAYRRRDGTVRAVPLLPLREATVQNVRATLFAVLGAVALLLLIACANVANLFLARGTSRIRELALRSALGAGRLRVSAQVMMEGMLLALAGGVVGVMLAYAGVAAFRHFDPGGVPRLTHLAVDWRILAFSVLVSIGTAAIFCALPALQAAMTSVGDALKEGAASVTMSRRGRRARNGLVITEIALAVVLMTGAGLLFRTFIGMLQVDPGFKAENLVVMRLQLETGFDDERRLRFAHDLLDRIRAIPGVTGAAAGATLPFSYTGNSRCCWSASVRGDPALYNEAEPARFMIQPVTGDYLSTLGAEFTGRDFGAEDATGQPVVLVNATAARTLFGTVSATGRQVRFGDQTMTVIGVENDLHHWGLAQPADETVYVPHARFGGEFPMLDIAVRTTLPLESVAPSLRNAVWVIEPAQPIDGIETMQRRVSESVAAPRFLAVLFGFFASVSLVLACAGIYSSTLYSVGQRIREMGIRLALGARGGEIVGMILRSGLVLAIVGIAIGTAAALAASRAIASVLWNVPPTDPVTYIVAAALLGSSAMLACLVPAMKASGADPMSTLRTD